ncbi:Peptidase family M28 [Hymenobacter gelipurpurascens]|uniref:Peptidase family M28 n=1 Tax=Hymenobacter gelipurpurascens TaxID=89968 RepID=A0A212TGL6_9BACT|nr:M28 family peptidase [Hymenobacter gelipurpurascens]SNC65143.1 Peptidase family M28 [Hymenobacter gelipurpurascens]
MKTSYAYLQEMCALSPDFNAHSPQIDPVNARVRYLLHALDALGVAYQVDAYDATGRNEQRDDIPHLVNVMVHIPAQTPDLRASLVFLAHHDVSNVRSENCNDNTASCANLLELTARLHADPPADRHVYIVFTDAEEIVSFERAGSRQLARRIHEGALGEVAFCVNLELTAFGTAVYMDLALAQLQQVITTPIAIVNTPFNDATVLRHWGISTSAVLGTLPFEELKALQATKRASCPTWARCHQVSDRVQHARAEDMRQFVEVLVRIVRFASLSEGSVPAGS